MSWTDDKEAAFQKARAEAAEAERDRYRAALAEVANYAVLYDPAPGWRRFQAWASRHDEMLAGLGAPK